MDLLAIYKREGQTQQEDMTNELKYITEGDDSQGIDSELYNSN